jgi:hypothetical protein
VDFLIKHVGDSIPLVDLSIPLSHFESSVTNVCDCYHDISNELSFQLGLCSPFAFLSTFPDILQYPTEQCAL